MSPARPRPRRVLTVTSTHTGGTPQTNRDLMRALSTGAAQGAGWGEVEVFHLNAVLRQLTLNRVAAEGSEEEVHSHQLPESVSPLVHDSVAYDATVGRWLRDGGFDVVHVQHLAWHGLGLLRMAKQSGAHVVFTFHDFYHLCPTVKLLDGGGRYCGGRCTPGQADCLPEPLWPGLTFPRLRGGWVNTWRDIAARALVHVDVFTAPHESVRDTVRQHLALPAEKPFLVVPHGRDWASLIWCGQQRKKDQALRILVPGHLVHAKGLEVVRELAAIDRGQRLHLHVLGWAHSSLEAAPGLTLHGIYEPEEFSDRVALIRPHIGAVFSVWNETWCHTLTEMWACGLPVVAFDFPTLASRIQASGAGWVWPMETTQALYQRILALDFMEVSRRTARTATLKPTLQQQTTLQMAGRYVEEVYGWRN